MLQAGSDAQFPSKGLSTYYLCRNPLSKIPAGQLGFPELQIPLDLAGASSQSYLADPSCKCSCPLKLVYGFIV